MESGTDTGLEKDRELEWRLEHPESGSELEWLDPELALESVHPVSDSEPNDEV